ncbi:uncharacterized protein LOC133557074 [Nerophis ophidion]|uniref:uncharacterized protein LOC133557074 n=1 Tax=Nerophis ophidion TaxID=159077 RepID=UPI002ADF3054|nr:uncharacterized protein LOC133557074 [Nerophis ophidion]
MCYVRWHVCSGGVLNMQKGHESSMQFICGETQPTGRQRTERSGPDPDGGQEAGHAAARSGVTHAERHESGNLSQGRQTHTCSQSLHLLLQHKKGEGGKTGERRRRNGSTQQRHQRRERPGKDMSPRGRRNTRPLKGARRQTAKSALESGATDWDPMTQFIETINVYQPCYGVLCIHGPGNPHGDGRKSVTILFSLFIIDLV